jgi:hypothetical protein
MAYCGPPGRILLLNPRDMEIPTPNGAPVSNRAAIPPGAQSVKVVRGSAIEWTIEDGIPYHGPTLMKEVKDMVAAARNDKAAKQ